KGSAVVKKIIVTGSSGFIGYNLSKRLLNEGHQVIGIDNMNDYYSVELKKSRLEKLTHDNFEFNQIDLENLDAVNDVFERNKPDIVINLAAQAGVRYSLENPHAYINSNIVGFTNILEASRHFKIEHLIYASSSSVYGANTTKPFSTSDNIDHTLSLYAATKKSNELMAHTYSHLYNIIIYSQLYNIPTSCLRFFTVYGPWVRPDMALFLFTDAIVNDKPIDVFNHGDMLRDFTYIDDIVESITRLLDHPAKSNPDWSGAN